MGDAYFNDSVLRPDGFSGLFARSTISLTVADNSQPDCPLVGVNQKFLDLTGYDANEVLGRNCRFLQPSGGAGPVCERMRHFLADPEKKAGRFVVANVTKHGEAFLNLLFMTKIEKGSDQRLVMATQFDMGPKSEAEFELYDRALTDDLRQLNLLTNETNWVVLGTYEALASSYSIIARSRLE